ncbi:hypothetical protein CAPTEDRAFT_190571 [Capitella teleta]|uniref:guanylate cyclase n=1 Tax=Capitella teleta TaxID=283909 RepID=R7U170_CAPTE|nr:hypothetical protein CAPTEDRAFT_190571 [Capitella teleta]|eukprot:ELT97386.1 hypothetical protein CAPTEDRAFT_190571 [Capitella teleta]
MYVEESDKILFPCSPHLGTLDELSEHGLYLSDIPLHDSTRDLILLSEQLRAEYELTKRLEDATDTCQRTYGELQVQKEMADKLLYSILPPPVADQLRLGNQVPPVKYQSATILFSGICDFNQICTRSSPIMVVQLLNELFQKFDALAEPRIYNVYKVETVGDKYMLASGLPERTELHARNMALVALDMMDVAKDTFIDGHRVQVSIDHCWSTITT